MFVFSLCTGYRTRLPGTLDSLELVQVNAFNMFLFSHFMLSLILLKLISMVSLLKFLLFLTDLVQTAILFKLLLFRPILICVHIAYTQLQVCLICIL